MLIIHLCHRHKPVETDTKLSF